MPMRGSISEKASSRPDPNANTGSETSQRAIQLSGRKSRARSASQTGLFAWTATSAAVHERPRQEREDQERHVGAQTRRPATAALVEQAERETGAGPHERDQPEPAPARPDVRDEVQDRRGRSQTDERRESSDHGR